MKKLHKNQKGQISLEMMLIIAIIAIIALGTISQLLESGKNIKDEMTTKTDKVLEELKNGEI